MGRFAFSLLLVLTAAVFASCLSTAEAPVHPTASAVPTPVESPEALPNSVPDSCPVTRPQNRSFVPSAAIALFPGHFWYGTPALSVQPRLHGHGSVDKLFWWSDGYDWRTEGKPNLAVTARRLDQPAPTVVASSATHAINGTDIGVAMLVGVSIPTMGCWEITGTYAGTTLRFVFWAP
ncbi:MAG: hypothetical protein ABI939_12810 [Anaerolineaceae bacterium]